MLELDAVNHERVRFIQSGRENVSGASNII
jgi:hypothetical protein